MRYDTRKYIVGVVPSAVVATVVQLVVGGALRTVRDLLRLVAVADDACVSAHRSRDGTGRSTRRREAGLRARAELRNVP